MKRKSYSVYMLASKKGGTVYIGVTSDLMGRVWKHKQKLIEGFTKKYNVFRLVYFEETQDVVSAIRREKQLKKWNRQWKIRLIEKNNSEWKDLYDTLVEHSDSRLRGNDKGIIAGNDKGK